MMSKTIYMNTTINARGQITIPAIIRRELDLDEEKTIGLKVEDGVLMIKGEERNKVSEFIFSDSNTNKKK